MQKHVYDQQKTAKTYMMTVDDAELKRFLTIEYPDNYTMQKHVYNQQQVAKAYMQHVTDTELKYFAIKE